MSGSVYRTELFSQI